MTWYKVTLSLTATIKLHLKRMGGYGGRFPGLHQESAKLCQSFLALVYFHVMESKPTLKREPV